MATQVIAYVPGTGRAKVDLTSWAGDAVFPVTPVATDQIEYPTGLTVGADGAITGDVGTYTIRLVEASTGTVYGLSYEIAGEGGGGGDPVETGTGTTSFTFTPPEGHTVTTLGAEIDGTLSADWDHTPVTGEQLLIADANGSFNDQFQVDVFVEEPFTYWFIKNNGEITARILDPSGLEDFGEAGVNILRRRISLSLGIGF